MSTLQPVAFTASVWHPDLGLPSFPVCQLPPPTQPQVAARRRHRAAAPVQTALVHIRRLPLGVREGLCKVYRVLSGARGHLEHANAALGRIHILAEHAQDGLLVPLSSRSHHHRSGEPSPARDARGAPRELWSSSCAEHYGSCGLTDQPPAARKLPGFSTPKRVRTRGRLIPAARFGGDFEQGTRLE